MRIRDVHVTYTDDADQVVLELSQCACSRYPELRMAPGEARGVAANLDMMAAHIESGQALRELEADHTLNLLREA